ncbi:MAG TPA: hypothetical protein EYG79_10925 [Rhodobacteraceae bacterium]|nr:hypothetical protein [Paracoccaceae bacterium]
MFRERLLRMIAKRVGNEPDAQDVLQEVFVRALRNSETLAEAHPFGVALYGYKLGYS